MENLYFVYIITREPTKEFERRFARWAPRIQQIQNRTQLNEFVQTTIRPTKEAFSTRFRLAFEELHEGAIQKYRMRYILGKLTQHVNEEALGGQADLDLGKFVKQKDVEHILPQKPTAEIRQTFDKPDEIETYIHRLGNLTLLESSINSSIQNRAYSDKRGDYTKSGFFLTRSLVENLSVGVNTAISRAVNGLLCFDEWTSESIDLRQLMLADLAERVWEMPPARTPTEELAPKERLSVWEKNAMKNAEKWPTVFQAIRLPDNLLTRLPTGYLVIGLVNQNQKESVVYRFSLQSEDKVEDDRYIITLLIDQDGLEQLYNTFEPFSRSWRGQYQALAKAVVAAVKPLRRQSLVV